VKKVFLSDSRENPVPVTVQIREKMTRLIREADLICYPMGSFYSSLIANLLPQGVGTAIAQNPCPKIFIPNTGGNDPETCGMSPADQVERVTEYLRKDNPEEISVKDILNFVLIDKEKGNYSGDLNENFLHSSGIRIIDLPLISPRSHPHIDEKLLVPVLLSLA